LNDVNERRKGYNAAQYHITRKRGGIVARLGFGFTFPASGHGEYCSVADSAENEGLFQPSGICRFDDLSSGRPDGALFVAGFAILAGILADRIGRKKLLLVAVGFYGIAGTAPIYPATLPQIIVSRAFVMMISAPSLNNSRPALLKVAIGESKKQLEKRINL
jgi:hypothetical protein